MGPTAKSLINNCKTPLSHGSFFCLRNHLDQTVYFRFWPGIVERIKLLRAQAGLHVANDIKNFPPAVKNLPTGLRVFSALPAINEIYGAAQSGTSSLQMIVTCIHFYIQTGYRLSQMDAIRSSHLENLLESAFINSFYQRFLTASGFGKSAYTFADSDISFSVNSASKSSPAKYLS